MDYAVIIVAAGRGARAGGPVPKQWRALAGQSVARWTVGRFAAAARRIVAVHPEDMDQAARELSGLGAELVAGGESRAASVRAGLEALASDPPDRVLIHDVARPCVTSEVIDNVLAALDFSDGAAPALAVTDALWTGAEGRVTGTQPRDGLFRAQTPQGFRFAQILAAHRGHDGTAADDVEVARAAGLSVAIVAGAEDNLKITAPGDFDRARDILERQNGHPAR
ncbi:2-C-methyl-D-erythritol 4-phosphate cytidylyltransferase [Roseivivax sp. GX 12232]|uniref:2-C-methyl-D-erythritol 4-phosphate cytidylyltransferase n=1 Tax=Roseivivax sp. GX 12232 TaxID=2900547 RepID=UPI00351CF197